MPVGSVALLRDATVETDRRAACDRAERIREVLAEADRAMYRAKSETALRVVVVGTAIGA